MSDSLGFALVVVFGSIVSPAIALYAAYWAFSIRRALVGRIYRNHALWLGAVCVLFAVVGFGTNSLNPIINAIAGISLFVVFPVLFAFIDTTVRVARRSDPLLRGILRWEKLRMVVWAELAVLEAFFVFSVVVPVAGSSDLGNLLWAILASFPFATGGPALLIGARRSRDVVLRQSMKWMGVALLTLIVSLVQSSILSIIPGISPYDAVYSYPALPGAAITIVGVYALYRSARSLAPINRLQAVELETTPILSTAEVR
jgi:hypothetical protein